MAALNKRIICTSSAPDGIGPFRGGVFCSVNPPAGICSIKSELVQTDKTLQNRKDFKMEQINRRIIHTPKVPVRQGIYSQAVVVDRTVYISGQLGLDVTTGQLVEGGVKAQANKALINIGEILKAAGCDYSNVVKTTVLLKDINDFNSVNEVYKTFFSKNFPARAAYQVVALPRGGLVEIEAVAVLGPLVDS